MPLWRLKISVELIFNFTLHILSWKPHPYSISISPFSLFLGCLCLCFNEDHLRKINIRQKREYYYTQIILVNIYIYKLGCMNTSFGCRTRVVSVSYLCCNYVQSAVSCYNFLKIARVAISYPYPCPCPCILVYKSSLMINVLPFIPFYLSILLYMYIKK